MWRALIVVALLVPGAAHADDETLVHAEIDPLPFVNGGYGGQVGIRYHDVRVAVASFSLHVPDPIAQLGGNDGFDQRVRPSLAAYALYYFEQGFAVGGSVRYLRIRYQHDDVPGEEATVSEISPEAIVAYQWHPFHNGFYLQPWFALGVALWHDGDATVGSHTYDELPISPFFTVNIGYEHAL